MQGLMNWEFILAPCLRSYAPHFYPTVTKEVPIARTVVDHTPERSVFFEKEAAHLAVIFGTQLVAIHHIGRMLSHLIVEGSQHLGHVAYLRGLQRGLEYPTSWVSARTPLP
jgi:hypothetical protein